MAAWARSNALFGGISSSALGEDGLLGCLYFTRCDKFLRYYRESLGGMRRFQPQSEDCLIDATPKLDGTH